MITKEVAAQKGPEVVLSLCAGMVPVVVLPPVWKVSAEVKELEGGQEGWNYPEENNIFLGKKQLQQVVGNSHSHYLPPADVLLQKAEVPDKEILAGVIVRIFIAGNEAVMFVVLRKEFVVRVKSKEQGGNLAEAFIDSGIRAEGAMHGIVGSNEQTGV